MTRPDLATDTLAALEAVLEERRRHPTGSHASRILADPELLQRKVMEEAFELCLELGRPPGGRDDRRVAEEAADVLFHVVAGLVAAGVPLASVVDELESRRR